MSEKRPKVGVGLILQDPRGYILLSERINSHGAGTFTCPGGHLEFGESFQECAARETNEETGIKISSENIVFHSVHNNIFDNEKHYVSIIMWANLKNSIMPNTLEPTKERLWDWHSLDSLPKLLFEPLRLALTEMRHNNIKEAI